MKQVILNDWETEEEVFLAFCSQQQIFANAMAQEWKILFASYGLDCYDGKAFVLCIRHDDNTLYEVNGSHCSCYGLEDQWEPEETSVKALRYLLTHGDLGRSDYGNIFYGELIEFLENYDD